MCDVRTCACAYIRIFCMNYRSNSLSVPQMHSYFSLHGGAVCSGVHVKQAVLVQNVPCSDKKNYFSVPRGLTYPDYTAFQSTQRSDLSRLHCISVSPEV